MHRDASQCDDQCHHTFGERQLVFFEIYMPICITLFILLQDLGVQSVMRTQLEPDITGKISGCLNEVQR